MSFAKKKCQSVNGKLIEPKNNETNYLIAAAAKIEFGPTYSYWLGIGRNKNL